MNVIERHKAAAKPGRIFGPGAMRALGRAIAKEKLTPEPVETPPSRQVLRRQVRQLAKAAARAGKRR